MRIRRNPYRTVEQQFLGLGNDVAETGAPPEGPRTAPAARRGTYRRGGRRPRPWAGARTGIRRLFTWRRLLAGVVTVGALLVGGFTVLYFVIDIPRANDLAKAQSNVYLYSDGTRLTRTGDINRESVPLDRVPKDVQRAFVAAENRDFYSDSGVSLSGTARGILNTVAGRGIQGGSTITQQYVKNYYLSQDQTVTRKVKELVISLKVDRQTSKDDILAGYLNTSYYGRLAYGVQAASRAYYGKESDDLTVEQGAYLAALLQAPSQYDWAVATPGGRRLAVERWNYVLDNMVEEGWLDPARRQNMRFPVPLAPKPVQGLAGQNGYLVDAARRELMASGISEQDLAGGGWRITLNIDPTRQRALENAVAAGLDGGPGADGSASGAADGSDRQAGAVSVDPRSGRIVALYGGRDYLKHYLNNSLRSDYQAGPTFAPVALAAAAEAKWENRGLADPAQIRRTATDLGMSPQASGFTAPGATTLGLMGVSPLEMAGVYATLSHDGKKVTPSIVKAAERAGEATQLPPSVGGQVVRPETAGTVTASYGAKSSLGNGRFSVVSPAPSARSAQTVTVGGPSDDRKADWFVGGSAELVTALALFGEDAASQKQVTLDGAGDGGAARIWSMYTAGSAEGLPRPLPDTLP
ncbi:transglycosylase domain-containing protein [Streptomyces peucetius]|nr:glycosyl transferase [Streptomyces peucetius subsp. caesius ATCC 27952]